jgi:hypothetical protein
MDGRPLGQSAEGAADFEDDGATAAVVERGSGDVLLAERREARRIDDRRADGDAMGGDLLGAVETGVDEEFGNVPARS